MRRSAKPRHEPALASDGDSRDLAERVAALPVLPPKGSLGPRARVPDSSFLIRAAAHDGPGVAERNTLHDRRVPPQALLRFRADVAFKSGERGRLGLICHEHP